MLDGFDEVADGQHGAALKALNATSVSMVVTSRADEYENAINATDVLTSAAVIVLNRLTIEDLAAYLPRTSRVGKWDQVLQDLRAYPDGPVGQVLTTPLMVSLARSVYSDAPDRDPRVLLYVDDRQELENYLLDAWGCPTEVKETVSQADLLAADRSNAIFQALAIGPGIAVTILVTTLLSRESTSLAGAIGEVVVGVAIGVTLGIAGNA